MLVDKNGNKVCWHYVKGMGCVFDGKTGRPCRYSHVALAECFFPDEYKQGSKAFARAVKKVQMAQRQLGQEQSAGTPQLQLEDSVAMFGQSRSLAQARNLAMTAMRAPSSEEQEPALHVDTTRSEPFATIQMAKRPEAPS